MNYVQAKKVRHCFILNCTVSLPYSVYHMCQDIYMKSVQLIFRAIPIVNMALKNQLTHCLLESNIFSLGRLKNSMNYI